MSVATRQKKTSAPSFTEVDTAVSPPESDDKPAKHNDNAPNIEPTLEEVESEEDRNCRYENWRTMVNYRNKTIQSLKDLLAKKEAQVIDLEKEQKQKVRNHNKEVVAFEAKLQLAHVETCKAVDRSKVAHNKVDKVQTEFFASK